MKTKTKATPSQGNAQELLIHIVKRDESGNMKDETLCGKLWDKPVSKPKNLCKECLEIAEKKGYKVFRGQ